MRIPLTIVEASGDAFADYGRLIAPQTPTFACDTFAWYENLLQTDLGTAEIGIVVAKHTGDYHQAALERHVATEEVIVPMREDIFLVLGKPGAFEGEPKAENFAAFYVRAGQAVALRKGVWHEGPKSFAMEAPALILYAAGTGTDDKQVLSMADFGIELVVAGI